jgi:hypothetical protein
MSVTFFLRISFVIIVGKRDIMKLFILPSSRNEINFDYHGKICQHLSLPFNQKPRHLNLSLRLSPTKGNSSKNVKKKEVLQAHAAQIQTLQNELESLRAQLANLKGKSSQPASHA